MMLVKFMYETIDSNFTRYELRCDLGLDAAVLSIERHIIALWTSCVIFPRKTVNHNSTLFKEYLNIGYGIHGPF